MKVVFPQAKELKNLISAAVAFLSEGTFKATKESISLASLEPSNVAIILIDMYQNMFLEYEVDNEEVFSINLEDLKKIISKAKMKEQIEWQLDKEKNRFVLNIKGKSKKSFALPLIEGEGNILEVPNLELPIKLEIDAKALAEIISSAKVVADEVKFTADPNEQKIIISAEGELKEMKIELTPQDESVLSMEIPNKALARYSIDYLYKLTKVANVSDTVTIRFDTGKPIWLDYKSVDKFRFGFILAPRE